MQVIETMDRRAIASSKKPSDVVGVAWYICRNLYTESRMVLNVSRDKATLGENVLAFVFSNFKYPCTVRYR